MFGYAPAVVDTSEQSPLRQQIVQRLKEIEKQDQEHWTHRRIQTLEASLEVLIGEIERLAALVQKDSGESQK
jgi:hypothetical protein